MTDRFDQLSPRDTSITLQSLGRRFSQALKTGMSSPDVAARLEAIGPGGQSLNGLIEEAARTQGFLLNELVRSLDQANPIVSAAVLDQDQRHFVEDRSMGIEPALESLAADALAAGQRISEASAQSLGRTVRVVGGLSTTPLAVGREAGRSGIRHLQLTNNQMEWLLSTSG